MCLSSYYDLRKPIKFSSCRLTALFTMQTLSHEYADEQNETGFYEDLTKQIRLLGKSCLAEVEYKVDFTRVVEGYNNNQTYVYKTGEVFRTNIFGQIAPLLAGTIVSAKGNHFMGRPGDPIIPISDGTKLKDVIVVEVPTNCNSVLAALFYNQIATLNDIRESDEVEEQMEGKTYRLRECLRNFAGDDNSQKNMVVIHMGCKYGRPPSTGGGVDRVKKRSIEEVEHSDSESTVSGSTSAAGIRLGAFYDPSLNEDYRGPLFNLEKDPLVQQDVRTEDGELVAPWLLYQALKPGVLILADCSLHVFLIKDKAFTRKIYQINAHSIRILDGSDSAPIPRVVPTLPSDAPESIQKAKTSSGTNGAFANFKVPKKFKAQEVSATSGSKAGAKKKGKKNEKFDDAMLL
ncbi:hypothetical protein H0H93_007055 [Arthromyces matolae]|nr:hypothetical protein H0H93_007055 [Arthromyces matolae]